MTMNTIWESKNKQVRKEVIEKGIFTKKPTEKTLCNILIENVNTEISPNDYPTNKLHSDYLTTPPVKSIIIGDACFLIDRLIERAIGMMTLNEKSLVSINIPPTIETEKHNVRIEMTIHLVDYKIEKPMWKWSEQEKYETSLKHKEMGTTLFKNGHFIEAFFKFSKACKLLITLEPLNNNEDLDSELCNKMNNLRIITYNNMAECHLHQKNYNHVITLCTKVLNREENNIKALYRRGVAHGYERNWEKAYDDMKRVVDLDSNNNVAKEKLNFYQEHIKQANQKMNKIMKKMFMAFPDKE